MKIMLNEKQKNRFKTWMHDMDYVILDAKLQSYKNLSLLNRILNRLSKTYWYIKLLAWKRSNLK